MSIVRTLIIEIEERDDGKLMISTRGNPAGDWLRRDVWQPSWLESGLAGIDQAVRITRNGTTEEPLKAWLR